MQDMQRQGARTGASVALFCALAVESFLSDFKLICETAVLPFDPAREQFAAISDLLGEMEESRLPIRTRYGFLYYALSGTGIPKGDTPYQDFDLLIEVRDALVHYKSYPTEPQSGNDYPAPIQKLLDRLANRKLVRPGDHLNSGGQWTLTLDTSVKLASWAPNAAHGIMQLIRSVVPTCEADVVQHVIDSISGRSSVKRGSAA
jgi:hypothetical protein